MTKAALNPQELIESSIMLIRGRAEETKDRVQNKSRINCILAGLFPKELEFGDATLTISGDATLTISGDATLTISDPELSPTLSLT